MCEVISGGVQLKNEDDEDEQEVRGGILEGLEEVSPKIDVDPRLVSPAGSLVHMLIDGLLNLIKSNLCQVFTC